MKNLNKDVDSTKSKFNSLGDVVKKTFDLYIITRFAKAMKDVMVKSLSEMSNFMENYNLFRVAMGSMSDDAMVFQNSMNSILGTDLSQSMRYQGFFQNLTTSLGIASKESLTLSTNLTKLTYDLSSLFNVPFEDMYSKLQSGMIGQTKPLRSVGIDVTMQTLQPYLNQMGIDKQVTQLTQAEKVLLRYIAILDQSSNAHGDFAITIEQPANQLKVLNNQIKEAYRWFGALFIGMFGSILPYINAFVMSLKEIFKSLAMFLGFKLPEFQSRDMGSDFEDMEESANGASGAIAKLNRQMRAFDEINNISTSSSAGGSAIGSPSVYKELLEYITGYDNKLAEIKMKASDIKDKIMGWLGYTKEVDTVTGEVSYTANHGLAKGIEKFVTNMGTLVNDSLKWIKDNPEMFGAIIRFVTFIAAVNLLTMFNPFTILAIALGAIVYYYDDIKKFWNSLDGVGKFATGLFLLAGGIFAVVLAVGALQSAWTLGIGAIAIVAGIYAIKDAIDDMGVGVKGTTLPSQIVDRDTYSSSQNGNYGRPGIPQSSRSTVKLMADGGFPSTGQMFIAREAGAEMVGTIGGRTAVANNNDIVQSIKQGVYEANVLSENKQPIHLTVNVGGAKVEDSMLDMVQNSINRGRLLNV